MGYRGNNGGGPQGPDEIMAYLSESFDKMIRNFQNNTSWMIWAIFGIFVFIGVMSSFYTVQPEEQAVILRMGKYQSTEEPGLHFKMPFGIDSKTIVPTRTIKQEEFGFRTRDVTGNRTSYSKRGLNDESSMLTGDLNVADVEWIVQFRISEPQKYLFNSREPRRNIRDIAESIMRRVVGDRTVNQVLTTGRVSIASDAQLLMQEILDTYDLGIKIVNVKLQDVNPPEVVKPSFNEVNSAKQEQEKLINVAERYYNEVIPEARGKAEETISRAEGLATATVNRAKGDAGKFTAILREYKKAPSITRKRIYLETMETLYQRLNKLTIVDSKVKGLLPIFGNTQKKSGAIE